MESTESFDQPGDYYGVIYRGHPLKLILGIVLAVGVWQLLKKWK